MGCYRDMRNCFFIKRALNASEKGVVRIEGVCEMNNFKRYCGELNGVGSARGEIGEVGNWCFFEKFGSFE